MTQTEKKTSMQALVTRWEESGLSQAKFAAQNNITLVKLRYWIHKLKPSADDDSAFIQTSIKFLQTLRSLAGALDTLTNARVA